MNLRAAPNRAQHCFAWIEKHTKLCSKDVFPSGFPPPAPREGKGTPPLHPGLWEPGGQRGGGVGMWVHVLCSPMSERLCDTRISRSASDHREERGRGGKKKEKEEEEGGEGGK